MKGLTLIILLIVIVSYTNAQTEYNVIYGKVLTADESKPIPNAHILSRKSSFGAISDMKGYFKMYAHPDDTLRISSIGYITCYFPLSAVNDEDTITILMNEDNIMLPEVEVGPLPDYETFKRMIADMPANEPFIIKGINDNVDKNIYFKQPSKEPPPASLINPVQKLYNKFNKKNLRKKRILRNRKKLNDILEKEGRYDEMLPETLDY